MDFYQVEERIVPVKCSKWPFRPEHITNDGETIGEDDGNSTGSQLKKLSGAGIIPNRYLVLLQTYISQKYGRPTVIIEFSPQGEPVTTHSLYHKQVSQPASLLHGTCLYDSSSKLRRADLCFRSYTSCARLFWKKTKDEMIDWAKSFDDDSLIPGMTGPLEFRVKPRFIGDRVFLTYDCPLLGLRECLFPIFVEDQAVGVFLDGPIVLKQSIELIKKRINELPSMVPVISEGIEDFIAKSVLEIASEFSGRLSGSTGDCALLTSDQEYEDHLTEIAEDIATIEKRLVVELEQQRERYVAETVRRCILSFRKSPLLRPLASSSQALNDRGGLSILWSDLRDRLQELQTHFSFRYLAVFGISHPIVGEKPELEIVAATDGLPFSPSSVSVRLDMNKLPGEDAYDNIYRLPEGRKALEQSLRGVSFECLGDFTLVTVGVSLHPLSSIALLLGFSEHNPSTANENLPGSELNLALQSFYTLVVSALSAILATSAEHDSNNRFRILRHELGQQTAGLDALCELYLSEQERYSGQDSDRFEVLRRNLKSYLHHVSLIIDGAKYSVDDLPEPHIERFLVFGELLYKWKDFYRYEANMKSIEIYLPRVETVDAERPPIYADKQLLEQLIYNLLNNAVKYCYRGTRISLDCRLDQANPTYYLLTVTDYGIEMPKDKRRYELFERGNDLPADGLGVGLWLARKIAIAHRGSIEHRSEFVSSFNVPLIEPYLRESGNLKHPALAKQVEAELVRLVESGEYEQILASKATGNAYNPFSKTILNDITRPTYRVTASVLLPQHGKERSI